MFAVFRIKEVNTKEVVLAIIHTQVQAHAKTALLEPLCTCHGVFAVFRLKEISNKEFVFAINTPTSSQTALVEPSYAKARSQASAEKKTITKKVVFAINTPIHTYKSSHDMPRRVGCWQSSTYIKSETRKSLYIKFVYGLYKIKALFNALMLIICKVSSRSMYTVFEMIKVT